uniref:Uncharacterized protein n=1 Tax=Vespula pensylvanica TaxID=30213 RepID=A0A834UA32_VESPE|nr:hypothetical protein H0235_007715 [Vespula pensylvanica]
MQTRNTANVSPPGSSSRKGKRKGSRDSKVDVDVDVGVGVGVGVGIGIGIVDDEGKEERVEMNRDWLLCLRPSKLGPPRVGVQHRRRGGISRSIASDWTK